MARHQDGATFMTTLTYAPYAAAAIALRAPWSGGGR
jgi:hypothetical protein